MATKGQKFIKYTDKQKTTALEMASEKGLTYTSQNLKININTIASWQFKKRNQKDYTLKSSKLEKEIEKLKQKIKKSDEIKEITRKFLESLGIK